MDSEKLLKDFVAKVSEVENSKYSDLLKMQNSLRFRIYKELNRFLPKYMKLNNIDHTRLIGHMSKLKMQYAKRNMVEDIQSNLFKIGVLLGLFYIAVPQATQKIWLEKVQATFVSFKKFITTSITTLSEMDVNKFFKTFTDLGSELIKVIMKNTNENANMLEKGLVWIMYLLTTLFLIELSLLVKVMLLDAFKAV